MCWELLTIILLGFYIILVKMYNFEQSAGNLRISYIILGGTSETYRSTRKVIKGKYSPWNQNSLIYSYNLNFNFKSTIRFYSTSNAENNTKGINPLKVYDNFKENKLCILKEQKDKSGVYCFINKINGNSYVGSSINLAYRLSSYLNNTFLKSKQYINMPIVKALLKYKHKNFSLLILEYIEPKYLNGRETYYITYIMPHYNVLKQGYSSLGYKHTEEIKQLLSELAKNRIHSDETKGLIARALTGENNPFYNKSYSIESKIRIIEAKSAYPVYIYNSFKELLVIFPSVSTLAKLIKSNHSTIVDIIKEQIIFRGEWYLLNIPYNISDTPLIYHWDSKDCEQVVADMNNSSHIKKAVFVYDTNKNFICKYNGVTDAQRALKINHNIIKNYAKVSGVYIGYIFSYERLVDDAPYHNGAYTQEKKAPM